VNPKREAELLARGFWSELLLADDDLKPWGGVPRDIYEKGEQMGAKCRKLIGSAAKAEALIPQTRKIQRQMDRDHERAIRSIVLLGLPKDEERELLNAAKSPPCRDCQFAAVCAASLMTCERFRAYADEHQSGGRFMVPDKTWWESFKEQQHKGKKKKGPTELPGEQAA
jgi:hypothetical protein